MSCKDFQNYLTRNPIIIPDRPQTRTLVIVSDSKGCYLQRVPTDSVTKDRILFNSRGGRTTRQAADIIAQNIDYYVHRFKKVVLAVWTFTCDFTYKSGQCIYLSDLTVDQVVGQCQRILSICRPYGERVKVVFLECPYYSVSIWNYVKGNIEREQFKESDKILESKIDLLNLRIRDLNEQNRISAPKFSVDLKKFRKSNKNHGTFKISFGVLTDGIHPCEVLSRYWLRRLLITVLVRECFD